MSRIALRQIAAGTDAGCLLTVEFPGDSAGPGLAATLAETAPGREVWRLDPVTTLDLGPDLCDYETLAARCVAEFDRLRPDSETALTVVGYCSAARFAYHVTGALTALGYAPRALVLVAGTVPDERTVWTEYDDLRRKLGAAGPSEPPFPLLDDPDATIGWLRAELTGHARAFVDDQDFGTAEAGAAVDEIVGRYQAWLWFLLQAVASDTPPVGCPTTDVADPGDLDLDLAPHAARHV
ncbi:hypothetical protein ONA91_14985 [Micromonospora sp. DR5-3]|uniref:hypothetical protein n=1 Tax=unclassified Micromonospora TaxID=2617518 RepID=UPI0011D6541A|nr:MULTISPECIES: hypothetical protein [unclassified Micromonospora]MCW3815755.1 hypothetical protein [Micromonospora sp. DR5-3]TYC19666.1 hypothetical protein FXF52_35355 [Micromonospora sp. MP36]